SREVGPDGSCRKILLRRNGGIRQDPQRSVSVMTRPGGQVVDKDRQARISFSAPPSFSDK
ncbi:TPA: hypothetical protein ACKPEI_005773, partial [Pseudomonas aeruginosa]